MASPLPPFLVINLPPPQISYYSVSATKNLIQTIYSMLRECKKFKLFTYVRIYIAF